MSSPKDKAEIEQVLSSLLEEGAIVGYEVPYDPFRLGIVILAPKVDSALEMRVRKLLPGVPLRFVETEEPEAL